MNGFDGGVLETFFRFQIASPASVAPAFNPMRGSGLGGVVELLAAGVGAPAASLEPEWVHATRRMAAAPETKARVRCSTMPEFLRGCESANNVKITMSPPTTHLIPSAARNVLRLAQDKVGTPLLGPGQVL